jgi:hypothetical protein
MLQVRRPQYRSVTESKRAKAWKACSGGMLSTSGIAPAGRPEHWLASRSRCHRPPTARDVARASATLWPSWKPPSEGVHAGRGVSRRVYL